MITQFSLRPSELITLVDMVGSYFRWFIVASNPLKEVTLEDLLYKDLQQSAWIHATGC